MGPGHLVGRGVTEHETTYLRSTLRSLGPQFESLRRVLIVVPFDDTIFAEHSGRLVRVTSGLGDRLADIPRDEYQFVPLASDGLAQLFERDHQRRLPKRRRDMLLPHFHEIQ
ncbi:Uu.00g023470.m01.CDS01 [Anthostomella pinea]|uniref:Uu.00g023470.m01.CDS01 n=1 Tax=Anthostomella pinea TaxID=933095 RepID=A0AAI8W034_9PEZI|nr:Uu.00g023470.m01.CDS01 [Anthostomella pinea]